MADGFQKRSKPSGLQILDCIRYVEPDSSPQGPRDYGFVYRFPVCPPVSSSSTSPISKPSNPTSLHGIFKGERFRFAISLGSKFRLARNLVSCIQELHTIGWIRKNINPRNVVFFRGDNSSLPDVENPYMINFRSSRPTEQPAHSERESARNNAAHVLYQHPDYSQGSGSFRDFCDYYSVGIVLLEIGSWSPPEDFHKRSRVPDSGLDLKYRRAFRDELLKKYVPRLRCLMGATYSDATIACLDGSFGSTTISTGGVNQGEFYDRVVGPLRELSMLMK